MNSEITAMKKKINLLIRNVINLNKEVALHKSYIFDKYGLFNNVASMEGDVKKLNKKIKKVTKLQKQMDSLLDNTYTPGHRR